MTGDQAPFPYDRQSHEAAVAEWRRARLARLTAADGWLSLVGRFALKAGLNSAGSAESCVVVLPPEIRPRVVGTFEVEGPSVRFTPAPGAEVSIHRDASVQRLVPGVAFPLKNDRNGSPDKLALGSLTMEVVQRSTGVFVRVRDPENPTSRAFPGIEYYPIDPKWRIVARLAPYTPHKAIDLAYEAGSAERYTSPGAAVFEVAGATYQVDPVLDSNAGRLYLVFWDETALDTTYGAGRVLYAPLPIGDQVLLDFNQAFSPPCAFTPYAVCPLAPAQNRLPIRVEAGEKSAAHP
jgi:uncharacterized protein (DUF1684 family)